MTVNDALMGVNTLGLDAAPIIYLVENTAPFYALCVPIFAAIGSGKIQAATSAITYTETLVLPLRNNNLVHISAFRNLLFGTQGLTVVPVTVNVAEKAADLRARYNLRTPDAVHIATAIEAGCNAFLTNDAALRRVTEIRVIVVSSLTL